MELPIALKVEIEKMASAYPQSALTAAAQELSQRYRMESGHGRRLLTKEVEALAYAVVRMPATYGAVCAVLEETRACFPMPLSSVLDVGAGTGAASWAARTCWDGLLKFTCLERENAMLSLGSRLMQADAVLAQAKWVQQDLTNRPATQTADLAIASYMLNELEPKSRAQVLKNLWQSAKKLLVLIEPGTPEGFDQLRKARDTLIDLGGFVVAPCPHSGPCPLETGDWCHFTCRVSRSRLHKQMKGGDVPYEDEKFTYLTVSKNPVSPAPSRILRHPRKETGRITLRLCGRDGIMETVVTKKHGPLFKQARKADSGDSFPTL